MNHGRAPSNPVSSDFAHLFDGSTLAGLTDAELLARFVATRDESAFAGLVARLGPMVLGVCRRMLADRPDADDAFQATFLVLVRRAGSVGRGDLIGPWLHGVAVRVCRRARAQTARRKSRERTGVVVDLLPVSPLAAWSKLDQVETRATIDDEIARLPEAYRRLVVLCDVEGLTRDEAADRLGWTPNMVRGRLARARARLRVGLTRRGCTPPGLAAPDLEASGWLAAPWIISPPSTLIVATARAALAICSPSGRRVVATTLTSTSALTLAEGVIRTMVFTSGKFLGASAIATATLAIGSGFLLAQSPLDPKLTPTRPAPSTVNASSTTEVPASPATPPDRSLYLVRPDLEFYLENKEAFPGLSETLLALFDSETKHRQSLEPINPEAVVPAHIARIKALQRDLKGADQADPLVAKKLELVRLALAQAETPGAANRSTSDQADLKTLREEHLRNVRKRCQIQQSYYDEGRITTDRLIDADRQVMQAEQSLATSAQERRASLQIYVNRLKQIYDQELRELEFGRATETDCTEIADALIEARILLAQQSDERQSQGVVTVDPPAKGKTANPQTVADLDRRLTEVEGKIDRVLDILNNLPSSRPKR